MPAQLIKLPNQLFIDLFRAHWNLYHPLESEGIEMSIVGSAGDEVFAFSVSYKEAGMPSRPLGQQAVLAFVIAPPDVDVERCCWPRLLSTSVVIAVIDKIQAAINASDDLTAHDRMELVQRLEEARAAQATGPRPTDPSSSLSPWHPKLLAEGQALSLSFAPALEELELKLQAYGSRLAEADCEAVLLGLSSQAELASCAGVAPRQNAAAGLAVQQRNNTRRGSLRRSIDCATQLADATQSALRRFEPYSNAYRPLDTIEELVSIHEDIQPVARSQRGKARWRQQCWGDADGGINEKLPVRGLVPVQSVPDATEIWLADRNPGRWERVHPFVRSLLLHVRFLWIRPFQSENGRVARLILAVELQAAGWPALPWELAVERHYDAYVDGLRSALQLKSHEGFLRVMMTIADDAIAIADQILEVVTRERNRLSVALRHPDCLGPALEPDAARDRAEELLKGILFEGVPFLDCGRFLLRDLSRCGALEQVSSPVGVVFSAPAVRRLLTGLF